ncbi:AraC family transcriptional regulator [Rhizobium sp. L1K21]|uniref:AraC family transcriptional regulator n=1 Tax=Rhizobium sp. L1K21 TaxID=2954933 RepID=UPI002093AEF7|nr:AraC family transcriptional regulator [Rhizobium sp. L1K21]MCO6188447.1 AraC family transcriptional regulator [Rhizobium sp. L1K21]
MSGDGLSAVLNSIKVSESGFVAFDLYGAWSIEIDYERPISVTVTKGSLWLTSTNMSPREFGPGDSFVLPRGISRHHYTVSSSAEPSRPVTTSELDRMGRFEPIVSDRPDVSLRRVTWGDDAEAHTRLISFAFEWQDRKFGPLIEGIPELIEIRRSPQDGFVQNLFPGLELDTADALRPGFSAVIAQLAQLFLVQAIRSFALGETDENGGLLAAMADPHLSRALSAIHNEPGKQWSLDSLAARAGLSRSVFAQQFREITNLTPMGYLRSWRVHLARRALREGTSPVSSIAFDVGYRSEAAFRASFRKETGQSPREYAKSIEPAAFILMNRRTEQSF